MSEEKLKYKGAGIIFMDKNYNVLAGYQRVKWITASNGDKFQTSAWVNLGGKKNRNDNNDVYYTMLREVIEEMFNLTRFKLSKYLEIRNHKAKKDFIKKQGFMGSNIITNKLLDDLKETLQINKYPIYGDVYRFVVLGFEHFDTIVRMCRQYDIIYDKNLYSEEYDIYYNPLSPEQLLYNPLFNEKRYIPFKQGFEGPVDINSFLSNRKDYIKSEINEIRLWNPRDINNNQAFFDPDFLVDYQSITGIQFEKYIPDERYIGTPGYIMYHNR
jgi:hypothetical protein